MFLDGNFAPKLFQAFAMLENSAICMEINRLVVFFLFFL